MITNLRIQNVALIDQVEVNFAPGLNVLTGETGAGKSILVDSINFLLGGRPVRDFVRMGAEFAQVEGIIDIEDFHVKEGLFAMGINVSDSQIMLERTMNAAGKSTCRINGRSVAVGLLKEAAALLVDVHGQHEHQSLLNPIKQLNMLDQFCQEELAPLKSQLEIKLSEYRKNERAIKAITGSGNQRQEQLEIWRFQLDEIEKAALKSGEEEELTIKRNRLSVVDRLSKNTTQAISLLYGSYNSQTAAGDQVAKAAQLITDLAKLDPTCDSLKANIIEVASMLTDITAELRNYNDELDANPAELERIETRLDIIYKTKKKYGADVETILKKQQDLTNKLDSQENSELEIKKLKAKKREIVADISAICDKISQYRQAAATKISGSITAILKDLGMKSASFSIAVTRKTATSTDGNDNVDFMISPNPGEPEKPLRRIASGGEMSRVMLAIKTVLADADKMETVIFDEVDTGVSGRTAQQVAEKLMTISRRRQILCITHLPQIAAMADTHFRIEKKLEADRTVTRVTPLPLEEATSELARLIGGAEITQATISAAREMKLLADGLKA
ncbi:MAG: DNA repair protein RecN [Defluviitaleaceae bacterium]|nr:DNA repair protein RecN [Defluviitaleaceae bacterium]